MNWIDISERLPAENQPIIVYGQLESHSSSNKYTEPMVLHAIYEGRGLWFNPTGICYEDGGREIYNVTHWRALPEPPIIYMEKNSYWQHIDTAPKAGIILLGWRCWNRSGDPDFIPIPGYWDSNQRTWMDATKWPHQPVNNPDYWMPIPSIPGDSI